MRPPAAWVFTSTFGGGLLPGDRLHVDLAAGPGTTAYVSSQSSTKVFRSPGGEAATQTLDATLQDDAVLVLAPDPVVPFAHARFVQTQRFHLAPTAGLVLLDWVTSGRHGRGERWAFSSYRSRNEVSVGGRRVLADALALDDEPAAPLAGRFGMDTCNCLATLVLAGARVAPYARSLLAEVAAAPVRRNERTPVAASPLAHGGVILRLAAPTAEDAARVLFRHLAFLSELLGEHPWTRKW
jgi:urease accessory protein